MDVPEPKRAVYLARQSCQPADTELNDNRIADNTLREVTPTHAAAGMGLAVLGALTGNINSGDFDKENYKGTAIFARIM